jgi:hypothetical protein
MAMAEEMGAEFHHLGSQKCNLENLEEICRICQYVPLTGGFHFVLIDEVDSASRAAQLALLSKLDSTDAPKQTVFVFTCNSTDGLEPRFLSRCLPIDFSSYGMAGDIAEYLDKVWHAEGGNGNAPDFARLSKECRNNVRDCLGRSGSRVDGPIGRERHSDEKDLQYGGRRTTDWRIVSHAQPMAGTRKDSSVSASPLRRRPHIVALDGCKDIVKGRKVKAAQKPGPKADAK